MLQHPMTAPQPTQFQLDLPLNPDTDNAEHVARSLQRLLGVAEELHRGLQLSESDLVQALTLATALRAAMAEMGEGAAGALSPTLLDIAVTDGGWNAA